MKSPRGLILLIAIAFALLSPAKAFSKDASLPWGVIGGKISSTRKGREDSLSKRKSVEARAETASSMEFSIQSKIRLADEESALQENNDFALRIIIMGGPASGKGTQCEKIASKYGVAHLSTGDMLREAVRRGSEIGDIAKSYMDSGQLVPDEIMIQIVTERISQPDCRQRGYLLDGFPRTPAQAEALSKMGISADIFVFLNVPDSELIARVVGRRLDPVTGKIYHMKYFPPPEDVRERLTQRSDDTVENMTNRLQQFHHNVNAVRSYYEDVLVEVDGTGSPDSITDRILNEIESKMPTRKGRSRSVDKQNSVKR